MRNPLTKLAGLATVLALGACSGGSAGDSTESTTRGLLEQAPQAGPASQGQTIDLATLGFDFGDPDAPVRVVEMSDFGCSYCRQFHLESFETLREEFIETGMVVWKFMPFITGMWDSSIPATAAAECALEQSPELFGALSDRLWTDQSEWKGSDDPAGVARRMADDAGVDMDDFDQCIQERRRLDRIRAATELANQIGVRGTPTFFVIGYPPLQGALPIDTFREILTAVHADATSAAGG